MSLREQWGPVIHREADWNWFGFPQVEDLKNQVTRLKNSVAYLEGKVRGGTPVQIVGAIEGLQSQVANLVTVFWEPDRPGFHEADKVIKSMTKAQQALVDLQRVIQKAK